MHCNESTIRNLNGTSTIITPTFPSPSTLNSRQRKKRRKTRKGENQAGEEAHNFERSSSFDRRLNSANGQLVTGSWNWRGRYNWPLPVSSSASRDSNRHHTRLSSSYARSTATRPSFRVAILFEISGNCPRPSECAPSSNVRTLRPANDGNARRLAQLEPEGGIKR